MASVCWKCLKVQRNYFKAQTQLGVSLKNYQMTISNKVNITLHWSIISLSFVFLLCQRLTVVPSNNLGNNLFH